MSIRLQLTELSHARTSPNELGAIETTIFGSTTFGSTTHCSKELEPFRAMPNRASMSQCNEVAIIDPSVERSPKMGGGRKVYFVELATQKNVANA